MSPTHYHSDGAHSHAHAEAGEVAATGSGAARRLAIALALTVALVAGEAIAGVAAKSLALLADAGHNLTDALALGLSWFALRLAVRPAHAGRTFGYHRAGILVAMVNSTTLVLLAGGAFYEAIRRFSNPPEVHAGTVVGVGLVAFAVNLACAGLAHGGSAHDLNLRASFLHLVGDVLASLGTVAAGIVIAVTGWNWLDPAVGFAIGLLIVGGAFGVLRETVEILMESTPRDLDVDAMVEDMYAVAGVRGVHDLHVWSVSRSLRSLSAHLLTDDVPLSEGAAIQAGVSRMLGEKYGIAHATLQLECEGCAPDELYCRLDVVVERR